MHDETLEEYRLLVADVYELAGSSRRTSDAIARAHGRTAAEWHVLSVLDEDERSVSAAARRLGLARQSVQPVVDRLVAERLLERRPDPRDARAPLVTTTLAGSDLLATLWAASEEGRAAALRAAGIDVVGLRSARATLRKLLDALADDAT